ncbi:unnamed protein product [Cylicocyclus nassatus]|uniref:Uncharacterized protein n=1 Tax=Cylicocyclus nassatus TaxID=53992 RepID=A0AA36DNI5_CYLNA|nr:unnamed protein product [Cylicocyclus nassatus]
MADSVDNEKLSMRQMLPVFAGASERAELHCIGYNVYRDAQLGRLIYNYNISWSDSTEESYIVWDHIVQKLIRSNRVAIKVPIQCDGPCGRLTDDYVQFGLCEHTVCRDCYENAQSADHEGLHGCCNSECLKLWKIEERRRKKKARKEEKIRAQRVRSDISYCMKYDDKSFEHLMERLRKSQKSPGVSTRTENITSSHDTMYSQG